MDGEGPEMMVEDAKRRLEVRIDRASHVGAVAIDAADILTVMRELGRVTAALEKIAKTTTWSDAVDIADAALAAEPASGEAGDYDLKCVNGHDKCYEGPFDGCPYCVRVPAAPPPPPTQGEG
jgi:hypothetical protein